MPSSYAIYGLVYLKMPEEITLTYYLCLNQKTDIFRNGDPIDNSILQNPM